MQRKWIVVIFLALIILSPARAEEGFWPFNMVPRAELEQKFGIKITDAWLQKIRLGSLRFNSGGSGSFVSPHGLVMTNHHIASDVLQKLSTPDHDLLKLGFLAKTQAEELKAPDLELNQLMSIEDVTARVKAGVPAELSGQALVEAREKVISAIEKEAFDKTGLRSEVVPLFRGAEYHLYCYKKYTDVRIVFAPEAEIGFFGGDPDNFTYPRFDLDLSFFRVYENGKPYETPNWFRWSNDGAKEGELTIVSGNPGGTRRLNAVCDLEFSRDFALPLSLKWLKRASDTLNTFAQKGVEEARVTQEERFGIENSLKDLIGQYEGLKNPAILDRKKEAEAALLKNVDPNRAKELNEAFATLCKTRADYKKIYKEYKLIQEGWGFGSDLFFFARQLVRLATERAKPDSQREREFSDAARESLELELFSPAPYYRQMDVFTCADNLAKLREELGADDPFVKLVLDGKTPETRAAELVNGSKLDNPEERKKIAAGGLQAIEQSSDPMIKLARAVEPFSQRLKAQRRDIEAVETHSYDVIAQAWKDAKGKARYPDGTFTPRLAFGVVKGYEENGKAIAPFTTLGGLYERAAQHDNKEPFHLPANWLDQKAKLNLNTQFNFVSTNDIIGGNSGSPVLNANAEVVGLIFDGNIHSLIGDYYYDETMNRAVSVDVRGMREALQKIYGAAEIVKELSGN